MYVFTSFYFISHLHLLFGCILSTLNKDVMMMMMMYVCVFLLCFFVFFVFLFINYCILCLIQNKWNGIFGINLPIRENFGGPQKKLNIAAQLRKYRENGRTRPGSSIMT